MRDLFASPKETEKVLNEQEQRLNQIVMNSPFAVSLKNVSGHYFMINPSFEQVLGRSNSAIIGRTDFDLLPDDIATALQKNDARVFSHQERFAIEEVIPTPQGTYVIFLVERFPILKSSGEVEFVCSIYFDITQQRRAEEDLKQSRAKLGLVFSTTLLGIWEWNMTTNQLISSDVLQRQFGYATGELPKDYSAFIDRIYPSDREAVHQMNLNSILNREEFNYEFRVVWPNGSIHWIYSIGRSFYDAAGKPTWVRGASLDITERKQAELALFENENRLKFALANANMGTWTVVLKTQEVTLSEESYRLFGLKTAAKDVEQTINAVIHPEDRNRAKCDLEKAIAARSLYQSEYRIIRPIDGRVRWIFATGRARYDQNGIPDLLSGIIMDISERKRAEYLLKENEERFKAYIEAMPQMAFISDPEGNIIYFNQQFYDYIGVQGPIKNWDWKNYPIHHPDDLGPTIEIWSDAIKTGKPYQIEYRLRRHNGEYRWHLGKAVPIRDQEGRIQQWFGTNTDITDQKRAFLESAKLAAIVQSSNDTIISQDYNDHITSWNHAASEMFGYTPEDMIGNSIYVLVPHDLRHDEEMVAQTIYEGKRLEHYETERLHRNGNRIPVSLSASPIQNERGENIGIAKIIRDITVVKKTQNALYEAIQARDNFMSIASHELKTPLTSLKLQTQTIRRNFEKSDYHSMPPERVIKFISHTDKQINRLNRLVDDMLDIARIQTGRLTIVREHFDLCELIQEVMERLMPNFNELGCQLKLLVCETANAFLDRVRIEQVITNLLTNALRYGERHPVSVSLQTQDGWALLKVRDQGRGIALENQERIFGRFERAISANEVSGLGLGLYITRQIVEAHEGRIWVESELGQGATFFVELPLE